MKLVIASANPHKVQEFQRLLPDQFEVVPASTYRLSFPPETGATFAENASAKAEFASRETGLPAIADDSGLVVPELGGAPGIHSARFAGEEATDEQNVGKLLEDLCNVPNSSRDAFFVCVVALAVPGHPIETKSGRIDGRVADSPRGCNGFGYDPIFMLSDGRTFAEMSDNEKDSISHRGQALRLMAMRINDKLASQSQA